jgi:hypothetical protein
MLIPIKQFTFFRVYWQLQQSGGVRRYRVGHILLDPDMATGQEPLIKCERVFDRPLWITSFVLPLVCCLALVECELWRYVLDYLLPCLG